MSRPRNEIAQAGASPRTAELGRRMSRPAAAIPTFDARWLLGIVVIVPVALTAGVYWLHQNPQGSKTGGPLVEVRLVQESKTDLAPAATPQPNEQLVPPPEPLIPAPQPAIPEQNQTSISPTGDAETTPAPSVVPAPSRQPSVASGVASAYQRLLFRHIARFVRYPKDAQPRQLHGIVQVRFAMRRDGTVMEAWVRTSSGYTLLDEAATDTVRRAQPLPAIPPDLPDPLTILLPVSFDPP